MSAQPTLVPGTQFLPGEAIQEPRGAEILIEALLHEGVESIFGYPGGAVLHIYDELWRVRDRITHYLVRHEQGAVHMAEGYARASGRVGVALVTSGPGATNAMTGIANAYMDSTPIVVITGYPDSEMLDRILAKGPVTVLKKPLKVEQLQQTVRILGHKDAAKLAA